MDFIMVFLENNLDIRNQQLIIQITDNIIREPHKYPSITAQVRASFYMSYKIRKFGASAHDTLNDTSHLICASYSQIFVSGDNNIKTYLNDIVPTLTAWDLNKLLS
jgi:hypothetical protein